MVECIRQIIFQQHAVLQLCLLLYDCQCLLKAVANMDPFFWKSAVCQSCGDAFRLDSTYQYRRIHAIRNLFTQLVLFFLLLFSQLQKTGCDDKPLMLHLL